LSRRDLREGEREREREREMRGGREFFRREGAWWRCR